MRGATNVIYFVGQPISNLSHDHPHTSKNGCKAEEFAGLKLTCWYKTI